MSPFSKSLVCFLFLTTAACANREQVIIDPNGVDMGKYQQDLDACRQIAEGVDQKAGGGAVAGAVVGGLVGAALGNSGTAGRMAGAGAVVGGASGVGATAQEKDQVVKNCMRNRGYSVLN